MKRGDDHEGSIGPMFPRLHVNDTTEKGGPRAPPRNKMALYEQLSIPSHTFTNKPTLSSSASFSQGSGVERQLSLPCQLSTPQHSHGPDEAVTAVSHRDHHEFSVPVFLKPRFGPYHDLDSVSSLSSSRSGLNALDTVVSENLSTVGKFRQEPRNESKDNVDVRAREPKVSASQERRGRDVLDFGRPRNGFEAFMDRDRRAEAHGGCGNRDDDAVESTRDKQRSESRCVEDRSGHNKLETDGIKNRDSIRKFVSLRPDRVDRVDDVSEASMVESISGLDIAPDDVVGIIGQKHFWKTRKAIVNQQRVFSVQVFELHRLIKVQKLIAESPHLLLEDGAFLGKSSFKCSPTEKLPPKFMVKPLPEKPSQKRTECSMENVFAKPPMNFSFPPVVTTADNKADPLYFHQPPGPQWLVPVMSPSEGLVYKPYPGPGFPGAVYGGYGPPPGPTPAAGNYANSPYGVQAPSVGPAYFPHCGTPFPNPGVSGSAGEQVNQFSQSQTSMIPGEGVSLNIEQQSSCNVLKPPHKNGPILQANKFQASKGSDVQQGSCASSPGGERENGFERRDPRPLFPVDPVISEEVSRSCVAVQPRVIKVVPHSRMSATESAARIFRFIQEERKQLNYG